MAISCHIDPSPTNGKFRWCHLRFRCCSQCGCQGEPVADSACIDKGFFDFPWCFCRSTCRKNRSNMKSTPVLIRVRGLNNLNEVQAYIIHQLARLVQEMRQLRFCSQVPFNSLSSAYSTGRQTHWVIIRNNIRKLTRHSF